MEDVGTVTFSESEVEALRAYLLKGGFLWVDDFWGSYAWEQWVSEISRVLPPSEYPILDITPEHPLMKMQYEITELPQIPSIQAWRGNPRRDVRARRRQRRAALPGDLRSSRQHHGADDAQHRHLGCLGARG